MSKQYISPQLRHIHRWVGFLALLTLSLVAIALFTAGQAQNWFSPSVTARIMMPESGLSGLSVGAPVEILGTDAGSVSKVVIRAEKQSYVEATIHHDFLPYLRDDSEALIRRQFGVAGAAYLEITRGRGKPLDSEYLVLEAKADRAPTETLEAIVNELREEVFPILGEVKRATTAYADLGESMTDPDGDLKQFTASLRNIAVGVENGEGAIGMLLAEDQLYEEALGFTQKLNHRLEGASPILTNLERTSENLARLSAALESEADSLPKLVRNVTETTGELTPLMWQLDSTLNELQILLQQLRSHWLLGGSNGEVDGPSSSPVDERLPPWSAPMTTPANSNPEREAKP